uniref:ZnMc domain-containing protein n=1 Tax=Angiostrongylus cantonensis TaxID=6313 RepID=A0A0K0CXD3_ANGCA
MLISSRPTGSAFKWRKSRLTYSIENFSTDLPKDDIRRAIRESYETWAAVTQLDFVEVPAGSGSDIKAGGVLAHATMPENGALHFDDDENWTYMDARKIYSGDYTDILAVAIHEAGHTLGLSHSRDESSIMAPFYHETVDSRGNYKKPVLNNDDISSIQDIYGKFSIFIFIGGKVFEQQVLLALD